MNFAEVRRAQLGKSTLTSCSCPGDIFRFLRSVQMLMGEWGSESNGKLPHLFVPGKTAGLVPEFAVEDLTSAELQPWFLRLQCRLCPWKELSDDDVDDDESPSLENHQVFELLWSKTTLERSNGSYTRTAGHKLVFHCTRFRRNQTEQ